MEQKVLDGLELDNLRFTLETIMLPVGAYATPSFFVPLRYGVLVGETIYNLRAALDYLVYELARHDAGVPQEKTQFPITDSPKKFADEQKSRLNGLNGTHVSKIEALQPYPDRKDNEWLADLQKLSNPDKHKTLTATPTVGLAFVQLWRFNPTYPGDDGRPVRTATDVSGQTIYIQYPLHLGVMIDGWTPVDDVLRLLRLRVQQTLDAFKPEF